jgi:hypothetical protein
METATVPRVYQQYMGSKSSEEREYRNNIITESLKRPKWCTNLPLTNCSHLLTLSPNAIKAATERQHSVSLSSGPFCSADLQQTLVVPSYLLSRTKGYSLLRTATPAIAGSGIAPHFHKPANMVLTPECVLYGSAAHALCGPQQARRQSTSSSRTAGSVRGFTSFRKSVGSRSSSSERSQDSPALSRSSSIGSNDAVAVVRFKSEKAAPSVATDSLKRSTKQHGGDGTTCSQTCSNSVTCYNRNSKCQQHARAGSSSSKLKRKLKAAAMFLAEGLSWCAHSRAALPVPLCPSLVA